jgi:hypothetical protein
MNTIDGEVRDALEVWRCTGLLDWDDVLARAGVAPPHTRRRPRLLRASLAFALLAVLATPALSISQRLQALVGLAPSTKPGLALTATLRSPSARGIARLDLRTSRLAIVALDGRSRVVPIVPVSPHHRAWRGGIRWRLTFTGLSGAAREARLVLVSAGSRRTVLTLCVPCVSGAAGSFRPTRAILIAMFSGSIRAELQTDAGATLSGLVKVGRPQHR